MKSYEIATLLFMSERTVEVHRPNIRRKLGSDAKGNLQDVLGRVA